MFRKPGAGAEKGFTLIEVMIVVAIIAILAAIAIPNFTRNRQRGYDAAAHSDIKNAFIAVQAYFTDNKTGPVNLPIIKAYGYVPTAEVTLDVVSGAPETLQMTAAHSSGSRTYTVDRNGDITN